MDFDLTEEQQATADLAAKLLADKSTPEAIRAVEQSDDLRVDRGLWTAMAEAGLLGIAVPESLGGAGLGFLEVCLVLEEVGRRTSAVPALAALACAGAPVARFGSGAQQERVLRGLAAGTAIPTAALAEEHGDAWRPTTLAAEDGAAWTLRGAKTNVPAGLVADALLVSAATADGRAGVFLVDPTAPGVDRQRQDTTTGTPVAQIILDGVPAEALGPVDANGTVLRSVVEHATVGACAVMAGVAAEAVRLTGEYTSSREQFGRAIATFQAVGQRAADAYVDSHAIRLTMLQAAWRLANGLPADREVAVAKYWAAAGGQRVVHAAQHLHGGIGVDRDYPLHRYFLLAKQLELFLGGASRQLVTLGGILAVEGAVRTAR
jgi:alkylation response protein AidB-like acyl-CoA dehydrogenase